MADLSFLKMREKIIEQKFKTSLSACKGLRILMIIDRDLWSGN